MIWIRQFWVRTTSNVTGVDVEGSDVPLERIWDTGLAWFGCMMAQKGFKVQLRMKLEWKWMVAGKERVLELDKR